MFFTCYNISSHTYVCADINTYPSTYQFLQINPTSYYMYIFEISYTYVWILQMIHHIVNIIVNHVVSKGICVHIMFSNIDSMDMAIAVLQVWLVDNKIIWLK